MVNLKIKKLHPDAMIPTKAHPTDSGWDLYALEDVVLKPLEQKLVKTGIAIQLPEGYDAQIRPRSGWALRHGLTIVNSPGTIDNGFSNDIGVILMWLVSPVVVESSGTYVQSPSGESLIGTSISMKPNLGLMKIDKGHKIAQLVISKVYQAELEVVEELLETERGKDGFGSTGS